MKVGRFAMQLGCSMIGALLFISFSSSPAMAQDHDHGVMVQGPQTAEQRKQANDLVATVREVTERFKDVSQAGPDYALLLGCVGGGDYGAMGLDLVNMMLVWYGKMGGTHPE